MHWERPMHIYRAYPMNEAGHFIGSRVFEAVDDGEAVQIACLFPEDTDFEIWCGARLVGKVHRCADGPELAPRLDPDLFD
jgi:hypothetical protein